MPLDESEIPFFGDAEPLSSEPRGFSHEQMVTCEVCLRANPPTRTSCLYCAASLPAMHANVSLLKPTLRPLEEWESGYNVVLLAAKTGEHDDDKTKPVAELLRLDPDNVQQILKTGRPMPLARASSAEEAALIQTRLADFGFSVATIPDADLIGDDRLPKRARSLQLSDQALLAHTVAGAMNVEQVPWTDIELMVTGRLVTRQLEIEERKRRKSEGEIVDAREISTDDQVVDIYFGGREQGLRVAAGKLDFSFLGAQKGLIAGQNFATLISILRERATNASFDESYSNLRPALVLVWPLEQHTEGRGWRRRGPGRVSTEAVTTSSNELQFTRYSRLLNYLRLHRPDSNT